MNNTTSKRAFTPGSSIRVFVFVVGLYAFPKIIRYVAVHSGLSLLSTRALSNGLGMFLAIIVSWLSSRTGRKLGRAEISYLLLGAVGSILFYLFSALFLDTNGRYIGDIAFSFALSLLGAVFLSAALLIYWSDLKQRKLLGLLLFLNVLLTLVLFILTVLI